MPIFSMVTSVGAVEPVASEVIDVEAEASAPTGVLGQLMRSGTTVEIRNTIADINQP